MFTLTYYARKTRIVVTYLLVLMIAIPSHLWAEAVVAIEGSDSEPQQARARSQTDEYIESTHVQTRARAQGILNHLLGEALLKAIGLDSSNNRAHLSEKLNEVDKELPTQLRQMQAFMQLDFREMNLSGTQLERISHDYRQLLRDLRFREMFIRDLRTEAVQAHLRVRQSIDEFRRRFSQYCSEGVRVAYSGDILPALQPLMPSYEIRLYRNLEEEQAGEAYTQSGVSIGDYETEAIVLMAINTVIAAKLVTGSWVLTGTAFKALAFSQQASILMGAGVATAAIIAVVVAVQLNEARKESERLVKQQRRMFLERATAEDGRRYFQESCNKALAVLVELDRDLELVDKGDLDMREQVEQVAAENEHFITYYLETLKAYHDKHQALSLEFKDLGEEAAKEAVEEALYGSLEGQNLIKMGQEMSEERLAKMISSVLLANYYTTYQLSENAVERIGEQLQSLNMESMEAWDRELWTLARNQKIREIELLMNFTWQDAMRESREIAALYYELDRLILSYAQAIFTFELVEDVESARRQYFAGMTEWKSSLDQLIGEFPNSGLLQSLRRDYCEFIAKESVVCL